MWRSYELLYMGIVRFQTELLIFLPLQKISFEAPISK